jgi:hypothetical protein
MAKAVNFRANNNAQGHGNRVRGVTLHDTSRERREPPKTLLSLLGSHRGADASRSRHRVGRPIRGSASLAGWCVAGPGWAAAPKDGDHRYGRGHNRGSHSRASHGRRRQMGRLARRRLAWWRMAWWRMAWWRLGWWRMGLGLCTGFALGLGLGAAPYSAYGGPYYGAYAYGGDCVMRRQPVINRWRHRAWRWVRVCY